MNSVSTSISEAYDSLAIVKISHPKKNTFFSKKCSLSYRNASNNGGVEKTSTRHMIREGEFIEWKHVVAVEDSPRNIG